MITEIQKKNNNQKKSLLKNFEFSNKKDKMN